MSNVPNGYQQYFDIKYTTPSGVVATFYNIQGSTKEDAVSKVTSQLNSHPEYNGLQVVINEVTESK